MRALCIVEIHISAIGALRTHGGDAHGREKGFRRVDARIARLAVNSASSVALFLIESWERKEQAASIAAACRPKG